MKLLLENWRGYLNEGAIVATDLIGALNAINTDDERVQNWRGKFVTMLKVYRKLARKNSEEANKYLELVNEQTWDNKSHHQWLQEYAPELVEAYEGLGT